jgi:hypothetical protein
MTQDEAITLSLRQSYQDFAKLIHSLTDQQLISPMSGWSPRDVMAHLIGWNKLMIEAASSILAGQSPEYYQDARNDYSNINSSFVIKYSSSSKQVLLAELQTSIDALEAFIHSLPAMELTADHGALHHSGSPATVARIIDSLKSDYQYHTSEIMEWLNG